MIFLGIVKNLSGFVLRNRTVFIMGLTALVIAGSADLFAGLFLSSMEEYLLLIPGMMILIYSALGMRGMIFGALGSRLGTAMHMGTFRMNFKRGGVLRANIESAICLTLILSVVMGALTWLIAKCLFNGTYSAWDFVFISTLGGVLAGAVIILINIQIAKTGFKHDWDVDNISAPLIAAVGDIVTMPMIFMSTILLIRLKGASFGEPAIMAVSSLFIIVTVYYVLRVARKEVSKKDFSGEAKRIVFASVPVLMFCLIFQIAAGMIIQHEEERLLEYMVFLVMLPAFLNQGNALSGMLTARLSSMIHLGTLESRAVPPRNALENFSIIYICAVLTFIYIGLISFAATWLMPGITLNIGLAQVLLTVLIAGMLVTTILNFLSYYVAQLAARFGLDPDDHSIPITSSIMDMLCSVVLVLVVAMVV